MGTLFLIPEITTINLCKELMTEEIKETSMSTTLLRQNNITTAYLISLLKRVSFKYVASTIGDLINNIANNDLLLYELDPNKLQCAPNDRDSVLKKNLQEFHDLLDSFVTAIINSGSYFPV